MMTFSFPNKRSPSRIVAKIKETAAYALRGGMFRVAPESECESLNFKLG
jgi:hypothetical protein